MRWWRQTVRRSGHLWRFAGFLRPYWDKQTALYMCMAVSLLISLVQPYVSRLAIDFAVLGRDRHLFDLLLAAGVLTYLFAVPLRLLENQAGFFLRTRVALDLRTRFYRRLYAMPLALAEQRPVGEHLYRLGPDLEGVTALVVDTLPALLVLALRLVVLTGICLWLSWPLTLVVLLCVPAVVLHARYFTSRQYRLRQGLTERSQRVSARLQDALARLRLIKVFAAENREHRRYLRDVFALIRLQVRIMRLSLLEGEVGRLVNVLLVGGVTYYLGIRVIDGHLTLGQMTALSMYLFQLAGSLKDAGGMYREVNLQFVAMDRVLQTLDAPAAHLPAETAAAAQRGTVETAFDGLRATGVVFGYLPQRPVLQGVDAAAAPGGLTVVTGPSGAGKTTLCLLLAGVFAPWAGTIRIGGRDPERLTGRDRARAVMYAGHDPWLRQATVAENIGFGCGPLTPARIAAAARLADAHEVIEALPQGYATPLAGGGAPLSLGQQQRVALARALAVEPAVLILDEALSALPGEHEAVIVGGLRRARPQLALVMVSHHPESLAAADARVALDGPRRAIEAQT